MSDQTNDTNPSHSQQPQINHRRQDRHRGAPPGNQNARKHGFYSKAIPPELRQKLHDASNVKGLDEEIALLRTKLAIAAENCVDYRQLVPGLAVLHKLLNTKKKLFPDADDTLQNAFAQAWAKILPPGISDPAEAYRILSDYLKSGAPLPPSHIDVKRVENAYSNQINDSIEAEQHDLQKTTQAQFNRR